MFWNRHRMEQVLMTSRMQTGLGVALLELFPLISIHLILNTAAKFLSRTHKIFPHLYQQIEAAKIIIRRRVKRSGARAPFHVLRRWHIGYIDLLRRPSRCGPCRQ
jgi:hypothetical protein